MDLIEFIQDTSKLSAETLPKLKEIVDKYPFFQTARLLYVANLYLLHDAAFGAELRRASVMVPDCTALFKLTEGVNYQIENAAVSSSLIETESDANRTISLIDSFLTNQPTDENIDKSEQPSITDLTTDYASFLMQQDEQPEKNETPDDSNAPKLRGANLIDTFIEETKGKQRVEMPTLSEDYLAAADDMEKDFISPTISDEDEEIYTESMVNIYIKQQRFEQALEILRKICANNPKKSSNFAAQIKLLEIIIAKNNK